MDNHPVMDPVYETSEYSIEHPPLLRTIKYAGNKTRLLPKIIRIINMAVRPSEKILDLMAGTHCVGYALKHQYQIYANDIQEYSYIIGIAFIKNGGYCIGRKFAEKELMQGIIKNSKNDEYSLFQKTYANTYFSESQCAEIDYLRGAIQNTPSPRRELYLSMLMSAMCYTSNTTGHFAEFLHRKPPDCRSIKDLFFEKCNNVYVADNQFRNTVFKKDYKEFLIEGSDELGRLVKNASLIYLDPPYSSAQYSRFYHLLETLVKYDYPEVEYKGLYRKDRYLSDFCRKSKVRKELDFALGKLGELCQGFILLSYVDSKSCLVSKQEMEDIARSHFNYCTKPMTFQISHSKLGNGSSKKVIEYLILATNSEREKNTIRKIDHHSSA
jgi:adenine-specific DNA-methyltransferase